MEFERAEVYMCNFPKKDLVYPTALAKPDYNIHGPHMAIMVTDHRNPNVPTDQALVIPISTIKSLNDREPLATYIPLKKDDYTFLKENCYGKTNQVQPLDRKWIGPKVGQINQRDMQQMYIGVMLSTGTYRFVEEYIDQQVTKRVIEATKGPQEIAATIQEPQPRDELRGTVNDFRRGDVIKGHFALTLRTRTEPYSEHTLVGEKHAICLTNSFNRAVPSGQVLVVPLLNEAEALKTNEHGLVKITRKDNPYLDDTYFAQSTMIQPLNRNWITDRVGNIHPGQMREVNLSVLESVGVSKMVEQIVDQRATKRIMELTRGKTRDFRNRDMGR